MPELPEVEHLRRSLDPVVVGAVVRSVRVARRDVVSIPKDARRSFELESALLVGTRIVATLRKGKQMALVADSGRALVVQLGMTGSVTIEHGEPSIIKTESNAADGKIDTKLYMQLQYPNGVSALAKGDFEAEVMQAPLTITGSKGSVHLPNFVVSGWDPRVIVEAGGSKRVEHMPSISTYTYQLLAFADAKGNANLLCTKGL